MTNFTVYTPENAPEKSRSLLGWWKEKLGFVPNVFGVMSESPALLKGYAELRAAYESGHFSPVEREIIHMTISSLNSCGYCVAAHSVISEKANVPKDIILALREERPLKDARLEALRQFTIAVMKRMGRVEERDLAAFYKAGFTKAHVLEVVLGVSYATLGNYVNHIAGTVLDKAFEPQRIDYSKRPAGSLGGKSNAA